MRVPATDPGIAVASRQAAKRIALHTESEMPRSIGLGELRLAWALRGGRQNAKPLAGLLDRHH
jgi:hypothetical protein